jgi:hypothetical protein
MVEPLRRLSAVNLRRYLDGQPLLNVVDCARGTSKRCKAAKLKVGRVVEGCLLAEC